MKLHSRFRGRHRVRHRKPEGQRAVPLSVSIPLELKIWTANHAQNEAFKGGISEVAQRALVHYRLTITNASR